MFSTDDSIVAIATPPGRGGLGVVRISGPCALQIAGQLLDLKSPLVPRRATFARARTTPLSVSASLDEVVATFFKAPSSYTGEHLVEVSAHGSPLILESLVRGAVAAGARLAQPGEFTLRAFLNGKRDLVQAEAVADLVNAVTPLQARVAFDQLQGTLTRRILDLDRLLFELIAKLEASLDFPDEGYHFLEPGQAAREIRAIADRIDALLADGRKGRAVREGSTVVITGRPNVGKSSVFNRLCGFDRAIVTDVAGTTRDLITERVDIGGHALTVVDTAGWRETSDVVEREGVSRGSQAGTISDLTLLVIDLSEPLHVDDERLLAEAATRNHIVVANKCDLQTSAPATPDGDWIPVSARTGEGFEALSAGIVRSLSGHEAMVDTVAISNVRHIELMARARAHLASAADQAGAVPEEFVLSDLQAARGCFDEVVGRRTSADVLRHIFERFCIGK